jgi:endonuclease VIII
MSRRQSRDHRLRMPEGHTLHRLARLHQRKFGRAPVIVSSPQGRFADGAAAVNGRVLKKASAWGKHLFHHYEGGRVVHVHLGLYGKFSEVELPMPLPVGQVRMRMVGADFGSDLRGPTVCELIDQAEVDDVIARLGPDPLRRDADGSLAWARITKSRRPIGALLMDQTVIAGVGNVYRNELLFRHRIDPYRLGVNIDEGEFDAMWTDLVALMAIGLRRGKIITIDREDDRGLPSYAPGRPRTWVYRRAGEPCRVCGTEIRTAVLEGRNLFWCPTDQT